MSILDDVTYGNWSTSLDDVNYGKMPENFRGQVERYLRNGNPPGGFLEAVIGNDLMGAINRADKDAADNLKAIVGWFYWEAPGGSWGSKKAFDAMIAGKGYEGMKANQALAKTGG